MTTEYVCECVIDNRTYNHLTCGATCFLNAMRLFDEYMFKYHKIQVACSSITNYQITAIDVGEG